ncbi:MAG TPA: tetratricopeptide repeat protein, partial [Bryobacteraceae bacterium]|nr:tetratricopeptide repeat protein [Bryobacteraceae bacterium]
ACFDQCRPNAEKPALFGKAAALQLLGRFDEAESAYERLLALDPAAREALSNLIAMHVERFNLSRVEHYSLRLRELDPQAPAARKGLALVAIERREYQAAAQYCSEISGDDSGADASTDGSIEYRLSWKVTGKLREAAEAPRSEV